MKKEQNTADNEYSVKTPSFIKFMFVNWKLWIVFSIIIAGYLYVGKNLYHQNYFGETLVEVYKKDVIIKQTRTTPNNSVLITHPLDEYKIRLYEVNLGLNCKFLPNIVEKSFPMDVELHRRNYNKTFYLKFPNIKEQICETVVKQIK